MAVAQDWFGLVRGSSPGLYTWAHAWGDPWLASYGGSTARLDGGAPSRWTFEGMRDEPESFGRLAQLAGWDYSALVTPGGPTEERVAAQRPRVGTPEWCEQLGIARYLFAPCVGIKAGERAVEELGIKDLGPLIAVALAVVLLVLVFK